MVTRTRIAGAEYIQLITRDPEGDWSVPEIISEGPEDLSPVLAADAEGGLHVAWIHNGAGTDVIQYRYRTPAGVWEAIEVVTGTEEPAQSPAMVMAGDGTLHLVWVRKSTKEGGIFLMTKDSEWNQEINLTPNGLDPQEPALDVDESGVVHMVWTDRENNVPIGGFFNLEIFYMKLSNGLPGNIVRVSDNVRPSLNPTIESSPGGVLHFFWSDNRDDQSFGGYEIYYRRFQKNVGWTKEKRFTYGEGWLTREPAVVWSDQNTLNVVWEDFRHGQPVVYFRQVTEEYGWEPTHTRLSPDVGIAHPHLVGMNEGGLLILWSQDDLVNGGTHVYFMDGHVRFGAPE